MRREAAAYHDVIYDFTESWAAAHTQAFIADWRGELVCDDCGGYKACFELVVAEVGCMSHARRKVFELHKSVKRHIAEQVINAIGQLYDIETRGCKISPEARQQSCASNRPGQSPRRCTTGKAHRVKVPDGNGRWFTA